MHSFIGNNKLDSAGILEGKSRAGGDICPKNAARDKSARGNLRRKIGRTFKIDSVRGGGKIRARAQPDVVVDIGRRTKIIVAKNAVAIGDRTTTLA